MNGPGWLRRRGLRYESPNLHEGRWEGPVLVGRGDQKRVQWELATAQLMKRAFRLAPGHTHTPAFCTIGPGMAHVDTCHCGAERSGVFGEWFLPRT